MPKIAQLGPVTSGVAPARVSPLGGRTTLRLKSWLPEHTGGGRAVMLGGRELPSRVGATLPGGAVRILCVGPGEWLAVSREYTPSDLRAQVEAELSNQGIALADLTQGLAGFEVRGRAAREVLSKGCGLDFHLRSFSPGQCARTRFAQIPLIIECLDDPVCFELFVARSHGNYLHRWLADAVEFTDTWDV